MSTSRELRLQIVTATRKMRVLIRALFAEIAALPDNPRIKRLDSKAFIVRWKDLSPNNWTAEFHDYKAQYMAVIKAIKGTAPHNAFRKLREIIRERMVRYTIPGNQHTGSQSIRCKLHPEVVEHLKGLL